MKKDSLARTKEFTPAGLYQGTPLIAAGFQPAYNTLVSRAQRQTDSTHQHRRHAAYATETTGLLLIAILLLALTVVRYWQVIHWSLR